MPTIHALICPQCNGRLEPSRFARSIVCPYCGTTIRIDEDTVSASAYREACKVWNSPADFPAATLCRIGEGYWSLEGFLARGESSDVYEARRARWPTERVVIKFLREKRDADLFDREWAVLEELQASEVSGADALSALIPQPVIHGEVNEGSHPGAQAMAFRRAAGFHHTLEDVRRAFPGGIEPRASIWVWRRILEILSFVHSAGFVHGAVLPPQLLVQENDHGIRIVGFSCAARIGKKLPAVNPRYEAFYPQSALDGAAMIPAVDLIMSARCIAAVLGGDGSAGTLPESIPGPLASVVRRVGWPDPKDPRFEAALAIREELGGVASSVYGAPKFCPIVMPK
ncbi:MAG: serine/threonine-protein kinase [Anaerolineales bacterium]